MITTLASALVRRLRTCLGRAAVLALAASGVLSAPVSGAPLRPIAHPRGPAVSDGRSQVAWIALAGERLTIQGRVGVREAHLLVPLPDLCAQLVAVAHREALLSCESARYGNVPVGRVVTLVDGAVLETSDNTGDESRTWLGLGRHWLAASVTGYHYSGLSLISRGDQPERAPNDAFHAIDLDRRDLFRPLCSPLRRSAADVSEESTGAGAYNPFLYEPPFGIDAAGRPGPLLARRCGSRAPIVLSRCTRGCDSLQLGAGLVSWSEGRRTVRVRSLRDGWTRTWHLRRTDVCSVAHIAHRLFVNAGDGTNYPCDTSEILTADLP